MTAVVPLAKLRIRGWTMQFGAVMISVFIIKDILFLYFKVHTFGGKEGCYSPWDNVVNGCPICDHGYHSNLFKTIKHIHVSPSQYVAVSHYSATDEKYNNANFDCK